MVSRTTRKIPGDETTHYVSARKKRELPKPKMQPPLTPMIDVTFQLLLFFLLTMTFRAAEGQLLGTLPAKGGPDFVDPSAVIPIRIVIRPIGAMRNGAMYEMGNIAIKNDPKELSRKLLSVAKSRDTEKTPIEIRPREDVRWRFVLEAYNQAVKAKFKNIHFATPG